MSGCNERGSTVTMVRPVVMALLWLCGLPLTAVARDANADDPRVSSIESADSQRRVGLERSLGRMAAIARVRKQVAPRQPFFQWAAKDSKGPLRIDWPSRPDQPDFVPTSMGMGVVWSEAGHIVTPYHVIDDPRQNDYFVWIPTGSFQKPVKALVAQVLAADPYTDLAVLKVAVEGLSPFPLADVEQIQPGDAILAVGDPFALVRAEAPQVVSGTIKRVRSPVRVHSLRVQEGRSNLDKETLHHYGTMMETSCPVPSGTSGSAILDRNGNWIGMAVSLAAEDGKEHPSGLAMTVDATFQRVARKLSEGGLPMFGFLGIQPEEPSSRDAQSGLKGARVVSVVRGMPGDVAGLQEEDLIVSVGGREIRNRSDLFRELSSHEADAIVPIQVMRRTGSTQTETLTLKARLSKKYVAEVRPSYSLHVEPQWRGLRVEYVTALPSEMMRLPRATAMPLGLAVKSVDPASGAWKAGLRPGIVIVGVEGEVLHTPEEFHTAVARRGEGPVRLRVLGAVHGLEEILVEDK